MTTDFEIRWSTAKDYSDLGQVMFDAVRNGPSGYNMRQRQAWVPEPRSGLDWNIRLAKQKIALAQHNRETVGFISLEKSGYIDFAFIRPRMQGSGLFRLLCEKIEVHARASGIERLWTHASIMAQPAFSAVGFEVVEPEEVEMRGEVFRRFQMEKILTEM